MPLYIIPVVEIQVSNCISKANKKDKEDKKITLDLVVGNVEAKSMVEDIIGFIKNPSLYSQVGARMPKGLLNSTALPEREKH